MHNEVNVLAMIKGNEHYVFLYDDKNRVETLRILGRYAADPQLSFTWYDAAVMSKKIREMAAADDLPTAPDAGLNRSRFSFRATEDLI